MSPCEPLVLAFDTSAAHCAAALVSGRDVRARVVEPMVRGHAERLLPMLEETLAASGTAWAALDALAVCTGPGNFTGIRIGVAAARGLALGLGVPAVGLTQFEVRSHVLPAERVIEIRVGGTRYRQSVLAGTAAGPLEALPEDSTGPGAPADTLLDPVWLAQAAAARLLAGAVARPVPFYQRAADAAPPAEAPPAILG